MPSGFFKGSQINWATLTKEAYAICRSVRKLTYYLEDADVLLRSDHSPLKKSLEKNTLNSKVNNWAVEISPFRIEFEYIKSIRNTLADTMSRLIKIIPDVKPEEEPVLNLVTMLLRSWNPFILLKELIILWISIKINLMQQYQMILK